MEERSSKLQLGEVYGPSENTKDRKSQYFIFCWECFVLAPLRQHERVSICGCLTNNRHILFCLLIINNLSRTYAYLANPGVVIWPRMK